MQAGGLSPGTHLNRLLGSIGFPEQVGTALGAALDGRVAGNEKLARSLFDVFSPLSSSQLGRLVSSGFANAGFCSRPHQNYNHHFHCNVHGYFNGEQAQCIPYQAGIQQHIASLLQRLQLPNLNGALAGMAEALGAAVSDRIMNAPNLGFEDKLSRLLGGFINRIQKNFTEKLQSLGQGAAAKVRKKKKKGGILKSVKKGLGKAGKMVKGFGKNIIKTTFKGVKSIFQGGLLKGLLPGNLLKLGGGLLGGMIGGPLGGVMVDQILRAGGKRNPIAKALNQFQQTINLAQNIQKDIFDVQKGVIKHLGRF